MLILFILLASAILSPSEYAGYEGLFLGQDLDFLGVSQKQSPASSVFTLIASPSTPTHSWNSPLPLEVCFPQLINSRIELAAIMRC